MPFGFQPFSASANVRYIENVTWLLAVGTRTVTSLCEARLSLHICAREVLGSAMELLVLCSLTRSIALSFAVIQIVFTYMYFSSQNNAEIFVQPNNTWVFRTSKKRDTNSY